LTNRGINTGFALIAKSVVKRRLGLTIKIIVTRSGCITLNTKKRTALNFRKPQENIIKTIGIGYSLTKDIGEKLILTKWLRQGFLVGIIFRKLGQNGLHPKWKRGLKRSITWRETVGLLLAKNMR